jgi:glutathione S-transferase
MLELYNAMQSTCSQKVRIILAEKGIDFVEHRLRLFKQDQLKPEYLKLNPNGVAGDRFVIMEYLDEVFPENCLTPQDPRQRAEMRAWMRFFEEVPTTAVRYPSYNAAFVRHFSEMSEAEFKDVATSKPLRDKFLGEMDKDKGFSDDKIEQAVKSIRKTVVRMETKLKDRPYLLGDHISLADICVLPPLIRMEDLGYSNLWSD